MVTLVDTVGAWPTFECERDGQSEAIATNLTVMAGLKVPIVTIVTGEGGSGGALGIGMGNIVGPSLAIMVGGPGALFWLLVYIFFGAVIKFTEVTFAVSTRIKTSEGKIIGGPMQYLKEVSSGLAAWYNVGILFLLICCCCFVLMVRLCYLSSLFFSSLSLDFVFSE